MVYVSRCVSRIFQSVPAIIAGFFVFVLVAPRPAHAYLDPGTGSYMFQIFLAGVLGFGVSAGMYWKKIKTYIAKMSKSSDEKPTESSKA